MRTFKTIAIVALLFAALVSCGTKTVAAAEPASFGTGSAEVVYDKATKTETVSETDVIDYGTWSPDAENISVIPWTGDISSLAKADGTLRFYFMAGEGTWCWETSEKTGDGCLVFFPNGQIMLIDSNTDGSDKTHEGYTPVLMENLKRLGVTYIDYFVLSHGHSDHYGGLLADKGILASGIKIGQVYYNGTNGHDSLIKACKKYKIAYDALNEGDTLDIGGVHIDILNPTKDTEGKDAPKFSGDTSSAPQNNASICMMFNYQGIKVLFDGDLYESGMANVAGRYSLAELDADIMKICHHGHSETSIQSLYVSKVSPKYAVISSGVVLNCTVYSLYSRAGATVMSDYDNGYMVFAVKDNKIYSKHSRENISDYYDVYKTTSTDTPELVFDSVKYPKSESFHASTAAQFLEGLRSDKKNVILDADINLYSEGVSICVDVTGKTIDLNGHTISGITCTDIKGNTDGGEQSCSCSFNLKGDDFTLRNGKLTLATAKGGYGLLINSVSDKSDLYGFNCPHSDICIELIDVTNGGIEAHGSEFALIDCKATQPRTASYSNDVATLVVSYSLCHIQGGTFNNYETLTSAKYTRWIKVFHGQAWASNGVRHNALATHYQYVTHSMFYTEQSNL